jgi:hypothetical protein
MDMESTNFSTINKKNSNKLGKTKFYNGPFSSFLETSSLTKSRTSGKFSLQELETLKLTTSELSRLKNGAKRSKKRYTIEQKPCSSVFKQDGEYFFDCTNSKAPDGSNTNKEWCYIENPETGGNSWDYCSPVMDFDKLREENQRLIQKFANDAKSLSDKINDEIRPTLDTLDRLGDVKEQQQKISSDISDFNKEIDSIKNSIDNLYGQKRIWKKLEDDCAELGEKIEKKTQEKMIEDEKNVPTLADPTLDFIKSEEAFNKQKIEPYIQKKMIEHAYNCNGKLLYEEETPGDGLMGNYFNNPNFSGDSIERKDTTIDFDWTGGPPMPGINKNTFSIRWEGFISIPFSTSYTFSVETDDGAQIEINNQIILNHRFNLAENESKDRVDRWLNDYISSKKNPSNNLNKSFSTPIRLMAGNKYKIVVQYSHSIHNDILDTGRTFMKLMWSSREFDEVIIPKLKLKTLNTFAPLKISGFNSDLMMVRKLKENDLAFKDSVNYILQDIPKDFKGAFTIKLNEQYKEDSIEFEINIPAIIYVAHLVHLPNPLPQDFEHTGERMSLLHIIAPKNINEKVESKFSAPMVIFKKNYDSGKVSIPLTKSGVNNKEMPMVIFFGFDNSMRSPLSCGGDEKLISDPTTPYYSSCSQSSFLDSNWKCENGFNGSFKDQEGEIWATKHEGIGSWIEITFSNLFLVTKFEIMNRLLPQERNSLIEAEFSDGSKMLIKLLNIDDLQTFEVKPPKKSKSVRFRITAVYGTINNGGSFNVYGIECKDIDSLKSLPGKNGQINPKELPPMFKDSNKSAISMVCKDSISNTKKLDHLIIKSGAKIEIKCFDTCEYSNYPIYGDMKYSKDSSICRSAFHAGILRKSGQSFFMVFEDSLKKYKSQVRNGIRSKSKGHSDMTISFKLSKEQSDIPVDNGVKIDFLDPKGSGEWLPGIIMQVTDSGEVKKLTTEVEGTEEGSAKYILSFPDRRKIKECGSHLKSRDCSGSIFNLGNSKNSAPVVIKFAPNSYRKSGPYLLDFGEVFGTNGHAYGWSRNMESRMRVRADATDDILDTLVEFPPDKESKFCNKAIPDMDCDKVEWSIKTGHGKFNVKMFIGDTNGNSRIELSVNGKPFIKDVTLEKKNLQTFEGDFVAVNQMITVTSNCRNDCEYAMAKLNMIKISQFNAEDDKLPEPTPRKEDTCGNAESGGRCDTGPDIINCLYDDPLVDVLKYCSGNSFMVQVPDTYKCATQRNRFKCVIRKFEDNKECLKYCPLSCSKGICS